MLAERRVADMGGRLVKAALGPRWAHLPHGARLIFAEMAATAKDSDNPPRYFGGRDLLASVLYPPIDGKHPKWHLGKVTEALKELKEAGAVRLLNDAYRGTRAEYELIVDPDRKAPQNRTPSETRKAPQNRTPSDAERTPKTGAKGPLKQGPKDPQNRGPKERRGKTEERTSLRSARGNGEVAPETSSPAQPTLAPEDPSPPAPAHLDPLAGEPAKTSSDLIAEWIDHCPGGRRPPQRVVGHVAREIKAMLQEGIPYAEVRAGLQVWQAKALHPSTLPSVVHEVQTANGGGLKSRRQLESESQFQRMIAIARERDQQLGLIAESDSPKEIEP
jgi:hypothetical protein